jgi:hypothetical protein
MKHTNLVVTLSLGVALSLLAFAPFASAQGTAGDKASAEALFNEGVSLVAIGSYAEGCLKFEGSQGLDATLGTELRLADCYERLGKTASAWATFKHAQGVARAQNQTEREELARLRFEALEPKLAYLSLDLDGSAPRGLVVERNGGAVPLASLGVAIPIDPGTHNLTARAPSHHAWSETIDVPPGPGKLRLRIPRLKEQPRERAATASAAVKREPWTTQHTAGVVTGLVGVAGILTGGGLGLHAKSEGDRSKQDDFCPTDDHNGCTAEGVDLRDRARAFGTAATICVIAGAALLTTGVVVWSTASASVDDREQARLELRAGGTNDAFATSLRGTW